MLTDFNSYFIGCSEIALNDDGSAREVQILKVGDYEHPLYGRFKITTEVLRKFKENFDRKVRKIDLAFNYEHGESKAHGTKAAGWIKNLLVKNNDSELWAEPDWTQSGLQHVSEKEYRYTSAEFLPKYKEEGSNKVHDWVLIGAALTNKPFIKGMTAIAASELHNKGNKEGRRDMKLAELKVELSEHGIDLSELQKRAEMVDGLESEKIALSEKLESTTKEKTALEGKVTALNEKVAVIEKEKSEIKFNELKKKGMDEGKLTKVMCDGVFKTMYEKNGAEFCEAYLSEAPKVVPVGEDKGSDHNEQAKGDKPAGIQLSEMAEKMAKEEKITFSEASIKVLEANPELAEAYVKESKGE